MKFLPARRYTGAVLVVIVCPSVRLFVTSRCSTKTAKPRITQTTSYDRPVTLVFWRQRSWRNSNRVTSKAVTLLGVIGDFRPISRYIWETVHDRDIVTMEVKNSCALYQTALFSVNLGDPNCSKPPHFLIFYLYHIFVVGGNRDFKFGWS